MTNVIPHDHERARGDPRAAELGVGRRVAIDHRGGRLEPQGLLHRGAQQRAVDAHLAQPLLVAEQVPQQHGDHPLRRLDPAE